MRGKALIVASALILSASAGAAQTLLVSYSARGTTPRVEAMREAFQAGDFRQARRLGA